MTYPSTNRLSVVIYPIVDHPETLNPLTHYLFMVSPYHLSGETEYSLVSFRIFVTTKLRSPRISLCSGPGMSCGAFFRMSCGYVLRVCRAVRFFVCLACMSCRYVVRCCFSYVLRVCLAGMSCSALFCMSCGYVVVVCRAVQFFVCPA